MRRTKFWHDVWCGDVPFKESFSSLFCFATSKEAWIDEVSELEDEMFIRNMCFSRHFQDWEMDNVKGCLWKLYVLGIGKEDKVVRKASEK